MQEQKIRFIVTESSKKEKSDSDPVVRKFPKMNYQEWLTGFQTICNSVTYTLLLVDLKVSSSKFKLQLFLFYK